MPWKKLGIFYITNSWTLTKPVEAELFRIKHFKILQSNKYYLKGAIAQAFKDSFGITTFDNKRFGYRDDSEIFQFYFPVGLGEHSLAFKRLDESKVPWRIEVEFFYSENAQEDYLSYIQSRFGNINLEGVIMALYPRLYSGSLIPTSGEVKLVKDKPTKLLSANIGRQKLVVRTTGQAVILATAFNETLQPVVTLEKIPANYNSELPQSNVGIYQGEVWAIASEETNISFTEFSAK